MIIIILIIRIIKITNIISKTMKTTISQVRRLSPEKYDAAVAYT